MRALRAPPAFPQVGSRPLTGSNAEIGMDIRDGNRYVELAVIGSNGQFRF